MVTKLVELSQCESCSKQQEKLKKTFFCNKCFNPSLLSSGMNCNNKRKKLYYHSVVNKFELAIDTLNDLIDLGVKNKYIESTNKKYSISDNNGLGKLEDLQSYGVPLMLLHLNFNSQFRSREASIYKTYLVKELLTLFENFILPRCTLFLPSKLNQLFKPKIEFNLLLFAILCKSEFMLKCLNEGDNFKSDKIIESLYFYNCYKSLLPRVNEPSLELVQASLLIADFETGLGLPNNNLSSIKALSYAQMLYLNDPDHISHKNDSLELKVEKFLTSANLIVYENKLYFYSPSPRFCKTWEINSDHLDNLPLGYRKWVNHAKLLSTIAVNVVNVFQIKTKLTNGYELTHPELKAIQKIIELAKNSSIGELPLKYFNSRKIEFESYHIAILLQFIFFNTFKIATSELILKLLEFNSHQFTADFVKLMRKEVKSKLKSAKEIIGIACESNNLRLLTKTRLRYLEISHSALSWSYFFSFRTLLSEGKSNQIDSFTISVITEKLRGFIKFWPTQKNLYDIITASLKDRGVLITYHELNAIGFK